MLAVVLLGTGCASLDQPKAVTRLPDLPPVAPGRPPPVLPKPTPAVDPEPITGNTGLASWYGEEHRGDLMANGQPFNPDALTAASWFFPFGTRVSVTCENRVVIVEITDRGPAEYLVQQGRVIDLSHAAFARLADPKLGLITVTVQPLP